MSELKAIRSGEIYNIIEYEDCYRTDDLYYPKSEADKVIEEKDRKIAELERKVDMNKRARQYWRKEWILEYKDNCQQKYKRCLAMAKWCRTSARYDEGIGAFKYRDWYWKWFKRWLDIAEKFKR